MPQQLSDILATLDPVYNPQKAIVQGQIDQLPTDQAAQQAGLDATKNNAFGDINVQANDRGLSYSGMPSAEQAKYLGATYLPAVANLNAATNTRKATLQDTLAGLEADRMKQGQSVYDAQYTAEQNAAAQVASAKAAAAANPGLDLGALLGTSGTAAGAAAPKTVTDHLNEDIQTLLPSDYATRYLPGYTERTVIPKLEKLYPELTPTQVQQAVYGYRTQFETPAAIAAPAAKAPAIPGYLQVH